MTKEEKRNFVADALEMVQEKIESRLDAIPEHWTGIELRWLILEQVESAIIYHWRPDKRSKRYRAFLDDVASLGLL